MDSTGTPAISPWRCAILALLVLLHSAAAQAAPADEVKALLEKGNPAAAYALAKKHPGELGNPVFDFYYGIAAIDSGRAGEGVLALERYVLTFPENLSARLQLARGYFALGEDARARDEFEALRALKPSPEVLATVERFLDAIRLRETRYTPSGGIYLEFGAGYDSNLNGGVVNTNLFVPGLGPIVVAPGARRIGDGFTNLAAGAYVSYPVAPGVALFGNAQGDARFSFDGANSLFDVGSYNLAGGVTWLREKQLLRFGLNYNELTLDSRHLRGAAGASVEWHYQLDEKQAVSLGGQYANLRYNEANRPRDAAFYGLNAAWRRQFVQQWQPILYLSVNYGTEDTRENRKDLVRDVWGGRAGVSFTPAARWGVAAGYSYTRSDYQGPMPFIGETRTDDYHALDAAVTYLLTRNLSLRAEALISRNHSNIALFDVPREIYLVKARYEFK